MDQCLEAASRETFSRTVVDTHQRSGDFDGDTQMQEPASGSQTVVADQEMSRGEVLDREARALETDDQMELEALGQLILLSRDKRAEEAVTLKCKGCDAGGDPTSLF